MTTLTDRPHTALLVVDVQHGAVDEAWNRDTVITNIADLVDRAREADIEVLWVQHHDGGMPKGSPQWEYVPELVRLPDEPVVHKTWGDSFEETDLEELLAARGIGRLVVAGAQTDACIRSTLHGALARGYDATLVSDAHTTEDLSSYGAPPPEQVVAHTNLYWDGSRAPGRVGGISTTAEMSWA